MSFTAFKIGSFLICLAAVVYAAITYSRLKNTTATYNRRLLSFARFSLSSSVLWLIQYSILPDPFDSSPTGLFLDTGLWLSVMQNALWVSAALSLRSKQFPRLSDRLPLFIIFPIVLVFALGTYRIAVLASPWFVLIDGFLTAVFFIVLAHSIWQMRLSRIYHVVFFIHGATQWIWRTLWFGPLTGKRIAFFWTFPFWRIVLLFAWIKLISSILHQAESSHREVRGTIDCLRLSRPLATITLTIGSTVDDLVEERDATAEAIRRLGLTEFRAEMFETPSQPLRDIYAYLAQECHVFILIIGERYGASIEVEGISVTEFQYQVARRENPEKILVYVKDDVIRDPRLHEFLTRVQEAAHVYIRSFITPEELYREVQRGIADWLTVHGKELK